MNSFMRRESNAEARKVYARLVLRHESTRDKRERESIQRRLKDERKNTMLAAVVCFDKEDKDGANLYYSQFREATGALFTITEDDRYISGIAGSTRAHGRQDLSR